MLSPRRAAVLTAGALSASACAQLPELQPESKVDPRSPVGRAVLEAGRADAPYPTWESIPRMPTDVRSPSQWNRSALETLEDGQALRGWVRLNPPEITGTLGYASRSTAFALDGAPPIPPQNQVDITEDWARKMREFAEPPPPPK